MTHQEYRYIPEGFPRMFNGPSNVVHLVLPVGFTICAPFAPSLHVLASQPKATLVNREDSKALLCE